MRQGQMGLMIDNDGATGQRHIDCARMSDR